jgi:hypothetical protein
MGYGPAGPPTTRPRLSFALAADVQGGDIVKASIAAAAALLVLVLAQPAGAHLISKPADGSMRAREASQAKNLTHALGAVRYLSKARNLSTVQREALAWHRQAVKWLTRQLERTRTQLHLASVVPYPWSTIGDCETTGDGDGRVNWHYNGSSGFDGGLQFHPGTWAAYRRSYEPAFAYMATPTVQVRVAERVLAEQGWGAWPACSSKHGMR